MPYFIIIVLLVVISSIGARPPSRIVQGGDTIIRDAPFVVQIRHNSSLNVSTGVICGGSIIGKRYIITAAHCILKIDDIPPDFPLHFSWFRVIAGSSSYQFGDKAYEIKKVHYHPNWPGYLNTNSSEKFDLAVYELKEEILFDDTKEAIPLADVIPEEGSVGHIFGWGSINSTALITTNTLQQLRVHISTSDVCKNNYSRLRVDNDELCVSNEDGGMFCEGDSGGGLRVDGKLAGVISNQVNCEGRVPGLVSNVAYYKQWIEGIMQGVNP
ncbi:trypsin eta [Fopius arisanus]|uniref:Trypsin eta n=1 Tax=Fopius arisanus TaxID=64838 RepID=A0A9R1T5N8_9HYME|nr:PREDICTED: trypsin eta-like [Fopius arisanus]